jgi:hypothetical protein
MCASVNHLKQHFITAVAGVNEDLFGTNWFIVLIRLTHRTFVRKRRGNNVKICMKDDIQWDGLP